VLGKRVIFVLGGSLLTGSGILADGAAHVDCATHPEVTQVFPKPRRTPDVLASLPCGEHFTVLQNGFIFSRIQTSDGQVGYIYSNLLAFDGPGTVVATTASPRTAPSPTIVAAKSPTQAAPPSAQAAPIQVLTKISQPSSSPAAAEGSSAAAQANTAASAPAQANPDVQTHASAPAATPSATIISTVSTPNPAPGAPAPATDAAPTPASDPSTASEARNTTPSPEPEASPATPQPDPAPAEPIRAVPAKESWERPNAGAKRRVPLIELFGGYGFARMDAGGVSNNFNGAVGSVGWNVKPWLQISADSSYSALTISGVKNVLYGNHYGPRIFGRTRNRWQATPFVEALVGGSRADTSVSGVGGYSTTTLGISYKVGGGLDIKPTRHLEIRLFDVDYYRTSFGTNLHQNNYWASAGIVLRLFGGSE
jgi:hypothetical protein